MGYMARMRWSGLAWAAGSVVLVACGPEAGTPGGVPPPAVAVVVETVVARPEASGLDVVGTVRSRRQTALSAKIVAAVRAVAVREGDRVRAGAALVELDDRDVRARLRHAEAALDEARGGVDEADRAAAAGERSVEAALAQEDVARATHARYRALIERELIARQDYEDVAARSRTAAAELGRARESRAALAARRAQATAAVARAQADLDNARIALTETVIRAPADAIVVSRTVEPGNTAAPGVVLLTVDEEQYRLEATVRESDVSRIGVGQPAGVSLDALGARVLSARVIEIVPAADPVSRTFLVRLELPPTAGVRAGLYGRARFALGAGRAVITVPVGAVLGRGQLDAVYVVDETATARLRLVKTGRADGNRVEVLAGLGDGEAIVVDGASRLTDGQRVTVGR